MKFDNFRKKKSQMFSQIVGIMEIFLVYNFSFFVWIFYRVRINSTFSVLQPFSYLRLLYLRPLYFDLCQIWAYYWSSSTGRSKILVEVKSVGRSTEKVELMRTLFPAWKFPRFVSVNYCKKCFRKLFFVTFVTRFNFL